MAKQKKSTSIGILEKDLLDEKKKLIDIESNIERLNHQLERIPPDFSFRDVMISFFGALVIALSFVHAGALIDNALRMTGIHTIVLLIFNVIMLLSVIYFVGYQKVPNKALRPPAQFIFKRFVTMYGVSLIISFLLIYLFALNEVVTTQLSFVNVLLTMALPASLGAAIVDLVKKY